MSTMYLLRHPKTGRVAQVVIAAENGTPPDFNFVDTLKQAMDGDETRVIHLAVLNEFDVVIV